jgi:hypothetical protein
MLILSVAYTSACFVADSKLRPPEYEVLINLRRSVLTAFGGVEIMLRCKAEWDVLHSVVCRSLIGT